MIWINLNRILLLMLSCHLFYLYSKINNNLVGENLGYSPYAYDMTGATISNVVYPSLDPSIFEVKYPNQDIQGRVVNL